MNNKSIACFFVLIINYWHCDAFAATSSVAIDAKYSLSIDTYFRKRDEYFIELLKLAVKKSGVNVKLIPLDMPNQVETRDVINLNKGILDVHWMHTSNQLESKLLPIRIPLDKGLFGWRLMLLDKTNADLLKDVKTAQDLKAYTLLQGYDWPDTNILKENGFKVETSVSVRALFRMLHRNRGDVFPRSVLEIHGEIQEKNNNDLVIDPYVLLYYPTAFYFFVAKDNQPLQQAIEYGLRQTLIDGSFDELFYRYYGDLIKKADISSRQIIRLDNPILPVATPLDNKSLWLFPEDILSMKKIAK